jgi:ATP-dependent helicase/nuclease subunit A
MKDRVPVARLINEALARTGYDAALLAEFLGQRKLANLQKLVEQARSFDRSGIFTLADFITQLSQFVANQPKEALAATHAESTDVVRLMTIHQSKGLEFPVVVVPDVDCRRRHSTESIAFTPELGPMVKAAEDGAASGFDLHALAENEEELAELTRLLYVATTRAADYLILSAGVAAPGSTKGPWTELLAERFDLISGACRGAACQPAKDELGTRPTMVRVTTTPPPIASKPSAGAVRRNVVKIIEKARQMAAEGAGRVPKYLAAIPPDAAARRQFSFSRLTGELHAPQPLAAGDFTADEQAEPAIDPRGLGTLVHAVLAAVDFAAPGDVAALVARHAPRHLPEYDELGGMSAIEGGMPSDWGGMPSPGAAGGRHDTTSPCSPNAARCESMPPSRSEGMPPSLQVPTDLIGRFLASPRAAQIAAAAEVHTELEFLLRWPPENGDRPDGRYLQGFIDCLYRDAAGWHVVDYKTNNVSTERLAEAAAAYEMQMLVYALAVERICGAPPIELALCFLRPGVEHHFPWNPAARQRAVEMVEQAMPPCSSRSA